MLRYHETGELHKDFHGSMNAAVDYVGSRYGREGLRTVFRATAQRVYRSIYEKLKAGDWSELAEHWRYFMEREGAAYALAETEEALVLTVHRCPAVTRLHELGLKPSAFFCDQTVLLNEAWCEGTPFEAVTEITGEGCCVQVVRKKTMKRMRKE
jgi:predicted ArsR family transcriptional regulator